MKQDIFEEKTLSFEVPPSPQPIIVEAFYALTSYDVALLNLMVDLPEDHVLGTIYLSVIHEQRDGSTNWTLFGQRRLEIPVKQGETLVFVARRNGHVVGSLVNEVCCDGDNRSLLLPKGGFMLMVLETRLKRVGDLVQAAIQLREQAAEPEHIL